MPISVLFLAGHDAVNPKDLETVRMVMSGAAPLGAMDVERLYKKYVFAITKHEEPEETIHFQQSFNIDFILIFQSTTTFTHSRLRSHRNVTSLLNEHSR